MSHINCEITAPNFYTMYVYSLHYEHAHCRSDILINIEMPA